ncbi:MAG: phage tail protein [bacterium]|nr:phage tail protein [bacterium]
MTTPIQKLSELHATFRFVVTVDGLTVAAFSECTLPTLQVETEDVKEGGLHGFSHKLPVRVNAGSVTLRRGVTKSNDLLKWYMQVLKGDIANATRTITLVILDSMGKPISRWTFQAAYPIKWGGPTLKTGESSTAIEEIEFVHHGFEVS